MSEKKPEFNEAVRNLVDAVLDEFERLVGPILRWMNDRLDRK